MVIDVQMLDPDAIMPLQAYENDAGWDLHVLRETSIMPGRGWDVRTGIAVAIPTGHYGRIIGRSSAFRRRGVLVVEGVIDSGFRGELFSYAYNVSNDKVVLERGDSIAQLIISPVPHVEWVQVEELYGSERGKQGFGSSGRSG